MLVSNQRKATVFVDYQQRAKEFSVGDLAYPLTGGSTDESQAGRVVAVYPAIGQVDIEFAWGSGRYPVEDLQRVTSIVAIPPDPSHTSVPGGAGTVPVPGGPHGKKAAIDRLAHAWVKKSLYWASSDRHYQATKAELDSGEYTCPKCKEAALKAAIYKRSEGKSERLLGCPSCLFLIKRCDIIGDADYESGEYIEDALAGDEMVLEAGKKNAGMMSRILFTFQCEGWSRGRHPMLDEGERWDDVADRLAREFKAFLSGDLRRAFIRAEHKGEGRIVVSLEASQDDIGELDDDLTNVLTYIGSGSRSDQDFKFLILGPPGSHRVPVLTAEVL